MGAKVRTTKRAMKPPAVVHVYQSGLNYDVYIGRGKDPKTNAYLPFALGNPYSHKLGTLAQFKVDTVEEAIQKYEEWISESPKMLRRIRRELRGKVLGCWCKTKENPNAPCHGDVLLKIANS